MDPQVVDGKYQLVRLLGQGGMGAVHEARNLETGRRVAVKIISSDLIAKNPDATTRFKREAKAAGVIDAPNVAQILDAGRDPATGDPYMVMELLSGEDLRQLIQRIGPVSPDVALRIAAQACLGLQAAHDAGIVHRDIKSANLFLAHREGGETVVKIVDFGIAKVGADHGAADSADLTRTGAVLGSPRYMSPEQAKGLGGVGPWSDVWSLGVVLFEMLSGTTPHRDVDGTFGLIMAICGTPAPPVSDLAPWVSREHAAIVEKALRIDRATRFASAREMLEAIRPLLPEGTSLREAMLVPLSPELKATARVAVNAGGTPAPPDGGGLSKTGETALNLSRGAGSRAPSGRPRALAALAVSLLIGAGGLAAYAVSGSRVAAHAPTAAETIAPAAPVETSPPHAAPPAPEERTAHLAVEPADATVEVDGRATTVQGGGVDVSGAPGSVHHVRVTRVTKEGTQETTAEVAITELGAVPPALRLAAPSPGAKGHLKPGPAVTGHAPASPGTTPPRAPGPSAPATTFE